MMRIITLQELLDMYNFYPSKFAYAMVALTRISTSLERLGEEEYEGEHAPIRQGMRKNLESLSGAMEGAFLSDVILGQHKRFIDKIDTITMPEATVRANELRDSLLDEFDSKRFLMIPDDRVEFYHPPSPLFGEEVSGAFPQAIEDISEAGACFALERYTAVVFHLMRAIEITVQSLAKKLGVTTVNKNGVGLTWGILVSKMNTAVDKITQGDQKKLLSETLTLLTRVKDAWRNETMHPKQTYTEEEARNLLGLVKALMRQMTALV